MSGVVQIYYGIRQDLLDKTEELRAMEEKYIKMEDGEEKEELLVKIQILEGLMDKDLESYYRTKTYLRENCRTAA